MKNICFPDPNILLLLLPFPFSPSFDFRLLKNLFNVVLVRFQEGVISDTRIQPMSQSRMLYYSSSTWVCVCVVFCVVVVFPRKTLLPSRFPDEHLFTTGARVLDYHY